ASGGRLCFEWLIPEGFCSIRLASERFCAIGSACLRALFTACAWGKARWRTGGPVVLLPDGACGWARVGAVRFAGRAAGSEVLRARPRVFAGRARWPFSLERSLRLVIFGSRCWALFK